MHLQYLTFDSINSIKLSINTFRFRSDNERYLHKSKVPTMHFQPSLPRLPIPSLEETCQRYLNAQLPLLDPTHFEDTQKLVANFQLEEGKGNSHIIYFLPLSLTTFCFRAEPKTNCAR